MSGARHSTDDMKELSAAFTKAGEIREHMKKLGHKEAIQDAGDVYKSEVIHYGSEVKALGGGKVGGYLVRFSDETKTDLAGDFFASDTDFGTADSSPILFHHGLDPVIGKKKLGTVTLKTDDVGIWVEGLLEMRDKYEKMLYDLAKKGKLGWSSGTASHLVERKQVGDAWKILSWPLGLDASLTPTPAEPQNSVIDLKSIKATDIDLSEAGDGDELVEAELTNQLKGVNMTQEEKDAIAKELLESVKAQQASDAQKAEDEKKAKEARDAEIKAAVAQALKDMPAVNGGILRGPSNLNLKAPAGDDAFKAFGHFLKTGDASGIRTGEAYEALKTTYPLVEATQYQGQEAVPTEVYAGIVEKRNALSIARAAGSMVFQCGSNAINIPIEKVSPGVFVIATENATYDENTQQPLDKAAVTIYNYTRTVSLGTQLLEDSVFSITDWWTRFTARGIALTENQEFLIGDNSGNPQGAVTGSTLGVTAAAAAALTAAELVDHYHKLAAEYRDNVVWVMAGATEGAIRKLTASTSFPFVGTGGYAGGTGNTGVAQGIGWLVSPSARVFNSASMDALTASKKPVLFGNFEAGYAIVERSGLTVIRDPYSAATSGLVKIISSFRVGGAVVNADALYHILTPSA